MVSSIRIEVDSRGHDYRLADLLPKYLEPKTGYEVVCKQIPLGDVHWAVPASPLVIHDQHYYVERKAFLPANNDFEASFRYGKGRMRSQCQRMLQAGARAALIIQIPEYSVDAGMMFERSSGLPLTGGMTYNEYRGLKWRLSVAGLIVVEAPTLDEVAWHTARFIFMTRTPSSWL